MIFLIRYQDRYSNITEFKHFQQACSSMGSFLVRWTGVGLEHTPCVSKYKLFYKFYDRLKRRKMIIFTSFINYIC